MSHNTLRQPAAAKVPKRTRTEWDEFIRRRETLNEERKRLDRESSALAKTVGEMDAELEAWLDAETAGQPEQQLTMKSFILSFVWQAPSAMAMAFKAFGKLTSGEKAAIKSECGEKRKLAIQWRDAPPPA
jgi:hypothetical protein